MKVIIDFIDFNRNVDPTIKIDRDSVPPNIDHTNTDGYPTIEHKEKIPSTVIAKERLRNRTMEKFVWNNKLYFRVGEFYGWLNVDSDFTQIGSSCYYTNRKKARHELQ